MFYWSTDCKSDPRFNMEGEAYGMFDAEDKINEAILAKAKKLGIEPKNIPKDIEYGGCKD